MNNIRFRKLFIIQITFLGIVINVYYGIELLKLFITPFFSPEMREILISTIALEFGWAVLLSWALFNPFSRRQLLLITAFPLIISNILHNIHQYFYINSSLYSIAHNFTMGIMIAGLFVLAYFLGKPPNSKKY